ncbi:CocE/NonD family hydrolase [Aldersonia kunmingensis]|uniref:CocE/NonD family hydrolase n=1 Tax=Aldersonia kunmingensis TaxID=408066 RepID=UPI000832B04F|nr:CocE/NonD family hydrolase [Aldersonia kunmingensis]
MRRGWLATLLAVIAVVFSSGAVATAGPSGYTSELLHFSVRVGPNAQQCTIIGELFVPDSASPTARVPTVLTTHGFGQSYEVQVPTAKWLASHGYVSLAYSGLGFGGSTCKVSLDDRDYDGVAAAQLVSFLGGAGGIAFTDPGLTSPRAPLDVVVHDSTDHVGRPSVNDPRVGMVGGSYGGGVQLGAAAVDPRIDTIVPLITWNDLSYSLTPNGTSTITGVTTAVPGAAKVLFSTLLFGLGVTNPGTKGYIADPARAVGCPNYRDYMCPAIAESVTIGEPSPSVTAHLRHASVATFLDDIHVPVLLGQGEQDTLFTLNEAVATYQGLKSRGVPVKMIWHSWGHSHIEPAPGEFDPKAPDPVAQYETGRILDWFDHYLKNDANASTGPEFAYFQPWVSYSGNARPAYGTSTSFPVGARSDLFLSGDARLVGDPASARPGSAVLYTIPGGLPNGAAPPNIDPTAKVAATDIPGTALAWTTPPLAAPLDVAGIPTLRLRVDAPGRPVIFVKVYDVDPNGVATLINGLVQPVRITNPAAPVEIALPGFVHRFAPGHSLRLAVTSGDVSFRGGLEAMPVTVHADGSVLTLPVVG